MAAVGETSDRGRSFLNVGWLLALVIPWTCAANSAPRVNLYISRPSDVARELHVACVVAIAAGSVRDIVVSRMPTGSVIASAMRTSNVSRVDSHVGRNFTNGFIQFALTSEPCRDLDLQCDAILQDERGLPGGAARREKFTFQDSLQISPVPENLAFREGETVELRCHGNTTRHGVQLRWESQRGSLREPVSQCQGCRTHARVQEGNGCFVHVTSTLHYTVTSGDNGLRFRCVLQSEDSEGISRTADFVVVLEGDDNPFIAFPALGALLGALVLAIVVIVVLLVKVRRGREKSHLDKTWTTSMDSQSTTSANSALGETPTYVKLDPPYVDMSQTPKLPPSSLTTDVTSPKTLSPSPPPLPAGFHGNPLGEPRSPCMEGLCRQGERQVNVYQNAIR